jgi:hypothetical protein
MKYDGKCQMDATTKDTSQAMANAKANEVKSSQGGTSGSSGSKAPKATGRGY